MPRRALRCIVDLQLHAVSAPGVWLPSKEDVYLSVSLFSQYRNTRLLTSIFPLLVHEKFRFEKTYYTACDPSQVAEMLEDELVIFELVQLSEYTDGAVRLASYSTNARDFLYPYPTLAPSYSAHEREVLMCRTIAFPGISPKVEFSTKTVIKESISPELDALDDAVDMERASRSLRRSRRNSFTRSRSLSPSARCKLADIKLEDTIDPRPPFVVRKIQKDLQTADNAKWTDDDLIGRTPSGTSDKLAKSKPKRSTSPYRSPSRSGYYNEGKQTCDICEYLENSVAFCKMCCKFLQSKYWIHAKALVALRKDKKCKKKGKVIRKPYLSPEPVYTPRYTYDDDLDKEVATLTSTKTSYISPRPRSVSPLLYRSSLRERYGSPTYTKPITTTYYESLAERELERARARRLARLYSDYYRSIDDLDLELRLARIRAGRYYY